MEVGKYADGRPLNYDEATYQFDVGGAPVTISDVHGYDRAGQIQWLSDELKAWAQALTPFPVPQAVASVVPAPSAPVQGKGLFGFRSRQPLNMVIASGYYLFAAFSSLVILSVRKPYATSSQDVAVEILVGLLFSAVLLSPALLLSDFGYRDKLPLFKKRKAAWSAAGLALFLVLMSFTTAIAGTLHTEPYKAAAAAEDAQRRAEAEARVAAEKRRKADEKAERAAEAKAREAAEASATAEAKKAAEEREAAEASATAEAKRLAEEQAAAKAADAAAKAAAAKAAEPKNTVISMGQTVTVGKFEYVVNSTSSTQEIGTAPFNETTTDEYLVVNLSIKNKDSESRVMDSSMFELLDTAGNVYEPDSGAMLYMDESFFIEEVNPGLTRTGDVVFEIPQGLTGLSIRVLSGFGWAGGESKIIKLDR